MIRSLRVAFSVLGIASILSLPTAIQAGDNFTSVLNSGAITQRTMELKAGWSFFSFNANPVFNEPTRVFDGVDINNRLYGFNPYGTSIDDRVIVYNNLNKYKFGPIYQNLGYWINLPSDTEITYWGTDTYDEVGTWLHEGWNMVAYPYADPQRVESIKIRSHEDGSEMSFAQARADGIVSPVMFGWTNDYQQGLFDIGLEEDFATNYFMEEGHAYWIQAMEEGYDIVITKPGTEV